MFIDKIHLFLPDYPSIEEENFLKILDASNTQKFDRKKFEKDFLLTLILIKFGGEYPDLIFKGWTCLNKVYFPYFRLSEDLDFVINTDLGKSGRNSILKRYENDFVADLAILGLILRDGRTKYDEYRLALFTFEYHSIIDHSPQTIKIDISLKCQLRMPPISWTLQAIFVDDIYEEALFQQHTIKCIDLTEALAEKMRAALTRDEPAIRDFFDIWYVREFGSFDFRDPGFLDLVKHKLAEVDYVYTLEENRDILRKQVITDLQPVLSKNYDFVFDDIFEFVLSYKV
jgi:predicted nucleotidyltransferase component of viral defense system